MKKTTPFILFFILLLSFLVDSYVNIFMTSLRTTWLTTFFKIITYIGKWYFITLFLLGIYTIKNKKNIKTVFFTMISLGIIVWLLKQFFAVSRPSTSIIEDDSFSFPSGHATFSSATFIFLNNVIEKYKMMYVPILFLTVFSRLYLGLHNVSDIVAGVFLGYFGTQLCIKLLQK